MRLLSRGVGAVLCALAMTDAAGKETPSEPFAFGVVNRRSVARTAATMRTGGSSGRRS